MGYHIASLLGRNASKLSFRILVRRDKHIRETCGAELSSSFTCFSRRYLYYCGYKCLRARPRKGANRNKEKPLKHVFDGFSDAFKCLDIQVLYFSYKAFSIYHAHL